MALTTTTLSSAVAVTDNQITVASATGFTVGYPVLIDLEVLRVTSISGTNIQVLRGQDGTATTAHVSGANVTVGTGTDFANPGPQAETTYAIAGKVRTLTSYTAAGAITLPLSGQDAVAVINGTATIAMTVAAPTKDLDGSILFIMGNGKSASTVTFASGIGLAGGSYDVATLQTGGVVGISVMAMNGAWVLLNGPITGTSTALSFAIA